MTFKQMELINKFIDVCKSLGVPDHECFATVDLYEEQNMNQVITCIAALMRKVGRAMAACSPFMPAAALLFY